MEVFMSYVLLTDSNCDLPSDIIDEIKIGILPMEFQMEDKTYRHYPDFREMSADEFYTKIKQGIKSTTSQINYDSYCNYFRPYLEKGEDILYICFSSGMSGSFNTCQIAIGDLQQEFPDRKIYVIDSLSASGGQGLLAYIASQKKLEGYDIEQLKDYIEIHKHKCCHWFVVDDLDHLKRGGRISAVSATFGKALQIKPLLSVDAGGRLKSVGKIRGKNNVNSALYKKLERDGEELDKYPVFITHADNLEGAKNLAEMIKPIAKKVIISDTSPVIGTHTGSGLTAMLFYGTRNVTM